MQEQIDRLMSSEYPLTLKHLLKSVIFLEEGKTELILIRMIMTLMLLHHQLQLEFTCLMRRTYFCIWLGLKLRVIVV